MDLFVMTIKMTFVMNVIKIIIKMMKYNVISVLLYVVIISVVVKFQLLTVQIVLV